MGTNSKMVFPFLGVAFVLAIMALMAAGSPTTAQAGGGGAKIVSVLHLGEQRVLPCYEAKSPSCSGQVALADSVVYNKATVTSTVAEKTPTGTAKFNFFAGNTRCQREGVSSWAEIEMYLFAGGDGVTVAELRSGPLKPGYYSYRVIYHPDAAAKALGFTRTPGECQQLLVVKPAVVHTLIVFVNDTLPSCLDLDCTDQVAPAGSMVHARAVVISGSNRLTPTGVMNFNFFIDRRDCGGTFTFEEVALFAAGEVSLTDSSEIGPLSAGDYSYRATYVPDAAAKALGFGTMSGGCQKLKVV